MRPPARTPEVPPEAVVPLEQYQRLLAEFDNYRKRVDRERARLECWAKGDLIQRCLLPLLDDFARARTALEKDSGSFDREAVLIMLGRLAEELHREGLTQIEASRAVVFDPEVHEAVLTIPTADVPAGCLVEVLQAGYRFGDRLLRPARVAVARAVEQEASVEDRGTG